MDLQGPQVLLPNEIVLVASSSALILQIKTNNSSSKGNIVLDELVTNLLQTSVVSMSSTTSSLAVVTHGIPISEIYCSIQCHSIIYHVLVKYRDTPSGGIDDQYTSAVYNGINDKRVVFTVKHDYSHL